MFMKNYVVSVLVFPLNKKQYYFIEMNFIDITQLLLDRIEPNFIFDVINFKYICWSNFVFEYIKEDAVELWFFDPLITLIPS